jgi:hypothetical protein
MTIGVYRVNAETGTRTEVRRKVTFLPNTTLEESLAYPRCDCPHCKAKQQRTGTTL